MLTITDSFSFDAVSNKGEGFDAIFRVRRIKINELQSTVKQLVDNHKEFKSILQTKKTSDEFSKILGINLTKFTSKLFTREDFMKINCTNILLYGEQIKDRVSKKVSYNWYLITIPSSADPNQ